MNRYDRLDKEFDTELRNRGINPKDVKFVTRFVGHRVKHGFTPQMASKGALTAVAGGFTGAYLGGELAKKVYPGDKYMNYVGKSLGATVGLIPTVFVAKKMRRDKLKEEHGKRMKLLEMWDNGDKNPSLRNQSDTTPNDKGEKTRLVIEGDRRSLTKLISTLKSDYPELKLQADYKKMFKSAAKSKIGKVIISSSVLGMLALAVSPKIIARLKIKNTKFIDVSDYRYTEDADKVLKCIDAFNVFLEAPTKSAQEIPYKDIEKMYLEALEAIERSSNNTIWDLDYMNLMWDTIFAFYNATQSYHELDSMIRIKPNMKSILRKLK